MGKELEGTPVPSFTLHTLILTHALMLTPTRIHLCAHIHLCTLTHLPTHGSKVLLQFPGPRLEPLQGSWCCKVLLTSPGFDFPLMLLHVLSPRIPQGHLHIAQVPQGEQVQITQDSEVSGGRVVLGQPSISFLFGLPAVGTGTFQNEAGSFERLLFSSTPFPVSSVPTGQPADPSRWPGRAGKRSPVLASSWHAVVSRWTGGCGNSLGGSVQPGRELSPLRAAGHQPPVPVFPGCYWVHAYARQYLKRPLLPHACFIDVIVEPLPLPEL